MGLFQEVLVNRLVQGGVEITFPGLDIDATEFVEKECYQALKEIQAVIKDDSLDDGECFMKIEEIITILEKYGSNGGVRHDFG